MATTRERLHELLDRLSDDQVTAVLAFAEFLGTGRVDVTVADTEEAGANRPQFSAQELEDDPMLRVLAAADEDDEPLTLEEAESIREGLVEYERGDYVAGPVAKLTFNIR